MSCLKFQCKLVFISCCLSMVLVHGVSSRGRSRPTRVGTKEDLIVNVLVVVDYSIYKRWREHFNEETTQNLKTYYTHVIAGIKDIYSSIGDPSYEIEVKLVDIFVAESSDKSPFTENTKLTNHPDTINVSRALGAFRDWMYFNKDSYKSFNVAILFTNYKMLYGVNGLAYHKSICTIEAVLISRDAGLLGSVNLAGHELGHVLGAEHDGEENSCSSAAHNLMTGSITSSTDSSNIFSECSKLYFKNMFLNSKMDCLKKNINSKSQDISSQYLSDPIGRKFSPEVQCKLLYGEISYYCPIEDTNICREMFCFNPSAGKCRRPAAFRAYPNTTCGEQKSCQKGLCRYDASAKGVLRNVHDSCPQKDKPGYIKINGKLYTCLTGKVSFCYEKRYSEMCCHTCSKAKDVSRPGCEYGDRASNCKDFLSQYTQASLCADPGNFKTLCCSYCVKPNNKPSFKKNNSFGGKNFRGENNGPNFNKRIVDLEKKLETDCPNGDSDETWCKGNAAGYCDNNLVVEMCCKTCFKINNKMP